MAKIIEFPNRLNPNNRSKEKMTRKRKEERPPNIEVKTIEICPICYYEPILTTDHVCYQFSHHVHDLYSKALKHGGQYLRDYNQMRVILEECYRKAHYQEQEDFRIRLSPEVINKIERITQGRSGEVESIRSAVYNTVKRLVLSMLKDLFTKGKLVGAKKDKDKDKN